jgi:hypothetical protein
MPVRISFYKNYFKNQCSISAGLHCFEIYIKALDLNSPENGLAALHCEHEIGLRIAVYIQGLESHQGMFSSRNKTVVCPSKILRTTLLKHFVTYVGRKRRHVANTNIKWAMHK